MLLSRRDFLKMTTASLGALALRPWRRLFRLPDFPAGEILGRVTVGKVETKARPDVDSQTLGVLYENAVVTWRREIAGRNIYRTNQRWVETPEGYIWSPYLQPARNLPNHSLRCEHLWPKPITTGSTSRPFKWTGACTSGGVHDCFL